MSKVYKRSDFTAAVHAGDTKKLKILLRSSKLSSIPGLSPSRLVTLALRHRQQKVAKLLLKRKFEIKNQSNRSANTPLHYAAKLGDLKLVKLLIRNGMDTNVRGKFGITPLHVTAIYNKYQIMEYLIQNGAILSLECTEGILKGYTPLHVATELNFHKCVRLLIKYDNSTVNPKNQDVIHPIHIAVMLRHFKVTQILLPHINNINVTFKDEFFPRFYGNPDHCETYYDNNTLLLCAISFTSFKITNLLVKHGANVQIKTALGKTALILAAETSNV
ncbi:ankyrin repeat and SOCS box protein 3-like [Microplitis demolitor]|uniref:ankyrin repeat and SOCS box protein 3-like n=1 Tax=Microplitis demolitor TaxID=69319 RepID=UPI00235B6BC8|nr:ankyrin repeat and SOCS box protein 3-like [Microplitis demolitor]